MPKQTANDLRKLAEAADGTRGRDLYFVVQDGELVRVDQRPATGEYVIVNTPLHGPGLQGDEKLSVTGGTIPESADAAFTSQSAFEKFVLPYYTRMLSVDELREMLRDFYAEDIICLYHEIGSITGTVRREGLYKIDRRGGHTFIG